MRVVYPLIPTSNHNHPVNIIDMYMLYILWFLHQTTTFLSTQQGGMNVVYPLIPTSNHNPGWCCYCRYTLYILWFLHQTTTVPCQIQPPVGCISFDSYIKPQLVAAIGCRLEVVYPLIPTSNHNTFLCRTAHGMLYILWFLHQTTTVNANYLTMSLLYILWFLHQTTT